MEWDPTIIRKFREEFGLSKSDMIRQFQRRGLEMLNWSLYDRWEQAPPAGVVPRLISQKVILRALASLRRKLEAERAARGRGRR